MLLLLQPLWVTVLSLAQAEGKKDDRSAHQAVQDGLLDGAETPSWQCAQQLQRYGNDLAAGRDDDCNHTRLVSLEDYPDKSDSVLQDLLTSIVAVSDCHVRRTPVRSNVRKYFQTVPRRIKLSRAGMPFSNLSLNFMPFP